MSKVAIKVPMNTGKCSEALVYEHFCGSYFFGPPFICYFAVLWDAPLHGWHGGNLKVVVWPKTTQIWYAS